MKNIILYLSLLFLLSAQNVRGQCLENPDFAEYCGTTSTVNGCQYFNTPCVTNWKRSHGTPQIMTASPAALNAAYMWSANSIGEGLFASYSIVSGDHYTILLRANASSTPGTGTFRIYATTGLTETTAPAGCGTAVPSPTTSQQITFTAQVNQGWIDYHINFTANANYSQIWIYPFQTTNDQLNLSVDYLQLCPAGCLGTLTYNSGSVPTGTTRASVINLGSSAGTGGSGTVTIASGSNTDLVAGVEINILPEFQATVTSNEMNAWITPCPGGGARNRGGQNLPVLDRNIDVSKFPTGDYLAMNKDKAPGLILLYPNPARDIITAQLLVDPGDPVELKLMTATGAVIKQIKRSATNSREIQRIQIPVAGLPKGIYFLQVINRKGVTIRKVEKLE
jgi:hypothetical protein